MMTTANVYGGLCLSYACELCPSLFYLFSIFLVWLSCFVCDIVYTSPGHATRFFLLCVVSDLVLISAVRHWFN
ncbi:hypothetical protein BO99DRAFT_96938 [Aspergillus violaceofuscus CBS 115571]|uniref:Uncharacterized protein n=1 Tax=Aspergillus violaceofuscus (strain CBS 115571) TaxID=1450538 RepID=A0A2V5HI87_ASPV1|nr:hypothetical protein BO99DRAFT_96938 [Aspergillus violaceofuscus CBS 115571]